MSRLKVVGAKTPKVPSKFPPAATFPPPRFLKVQDDDEGNNRNCWKFFEYWKECAGTKDNPTDKADLIEVRWYLHWPVVDMTLADPKPKNTVFQMMQGPMWFEDPRDYVEECLKLFGSASWHVCLNEANVHSSLMQAYFPASDLNRYPPIKIDLNTLVVGHPQNETYIRRLRVEGVQLPWETNAEEEENEMANETMTGVFGILEKQADAIISATKEVAGVRIEAAQQEMERAREENKEAKAAGTIDAAVVNAGMELLANAANKSIDMVAQHAGSQLNTVEVMKTAAELFRPQQDQGIALLVEALKDQNAKMIENQHSEREFMRSVIGMKKNQDGTWTAGEAQQQTSGLEAELARFERMGSLLGWARPGAMTQRPEQPEPQPPQYPPEKSFWATVAENPVPVITGVTALITLVANCIYNLRAEPSKTISPQESLQKMAAQQPAPVQQQQPVAIDPKNPQNWIPFAKDLHERGHFKAHFLGKDAGRDGYSFAEFILSNRTGGGITEVGRKAYNSIKENLGFQGFDQLIHMYPPLLEIVKDTPDQYHKFLTEFFTYDEMIESQQQEEGVKAS